MNHERTPHRRKIMTLRDDQYCVRKIRRRKTNSRPAHTPKHNKPRSIGIAPYLFVLTSGSGQSKKAKHLSHPPVQRLITFSPCRFASVSSWLVSHRPNSSHQLGSPRRAVLVSCVMLPFHRSQAAVSSPLFNVLFPRGVNNGRTMSEIW